MEETIQIKLNTLNSLLPQQIPFVVQQITAALRLVENEESYEKALDIAITVAEKVKQFSQGDILYNYTPILLSLLQFVPEDTDLSVFDTVNHDVPIGVAQVKQFVDSYAKNVKNAPNTLASLKDNNNICMVILATILHDLQEDKNILPIAYIILNLNVSKIQFINESFQLYCNILTEINNREF